MPRGKKGNYVSETQQRLCELADTLGISNREFSRSIGMSENYVASLSNDISLGVVNKILIVYPQVNVVWLVTGKGDRLIKPNSSDAAQDYIIKENRELKEKNEKLIEQNTKLFAEVSVLRYRLSQREQGYAGLVAESNDAESYGK